MPQPLSYRVKLERERLALSKLEQAIYILDDVVVHTQDEHRQEIIKGCRQVLLGVKKDIEQNDFMKLD